MANTLVMAGAGIGAMLMPLIGKIVFAIIVYLVGKWLIGKVVTLMEKSKKFAELDGAVQTFAKSGVKLGLFALLFVSIIGILGVETSSIVAAVGNVLPSVLIILAIAFFFESFSDNRVVNNVFMGLRPAVVALIAAPVFSVAKSARIGWTNVWIPILSALLIVAMGVSPVYIIMVAAVAGLVWGRLKGGKG